MLVSGIDIVRVVTSMFVAKAETVPALLRMSVDDRDAVFGPRQRCRPRNRLHVAPGVHGVLADDKRNRESNRLAPLGLRSKSDQWAKFSPNPT